MNLNASTAALSAAFSAGGYTSLDQLLEVDEVGRYASLYDRFLNGSIQVGAMRADVAIARFPGVKSLRVIHDAKCTSTTSASCWRRYLCGPPLAERCANALVTLDLTDAVGDGKWCCGRRDAGTFVNKLPALRTLLVGRRVD